MTNNVLQDFDPARLRRWLWLFFAALAIPAAVLVTHAYRQLKWESFHQHSQQASELALQIDQRLIDLLRQEDQRPFSDYFFLSAAGTSNLLQRSPLAQFPVGETIPGLIGYFQVNDSGSFSSPLLPPGTEGARFGIDAAEWLARRQLSDRLRDLLVDNALVSRLPSPPDQAHQTTGKRESHSDDTQFADSAINGADALLAEEESKDADFPESAPARPTAVDETVATERVDIAYAARDRKLNSSSAFDRLNQSRTPARNLSSQVKVSELRLDQRQLEQRASEEQPAADSISQVASRTKRREQVYLPEGDLSNEGSSLGRAVTIDTFESELNPLEFSLLDSGHFVLFRKVRRDDKRYVQGALLDQAAFLRGAVEAPFRNSSLARVSELVIAFHDQILQAVSGAPAGTYPDIDPVLGGTLLHRHQLAPPLSDLELLLTVKQLPAGAGAGLLAVTTAVLALVLSGGLYALYRLGVGQIRLARQQQDFVSAVSHELKTPLTSIRMYSEMLREGWAGEDKRRGYYDFIHDESERLSRLIENVLQLARMTRNELELDVQRHSVTTILDMLQSKVASAVTQAGFELRVDRPRALGDTQLEVDLDCLAQVFINLIDNALKFSANASLAQIDVAVTKRSGSVQFTIRDYGPGIAKDQMKKIFLLFYRPRSEMTRETAGTGIGLALVHQLVQAMDGRIDLRNVEPGAEFSLTFPSCSLE